MQLSASVDTSRLDRKLQVIAATTKDPSTPLKWFAAWYGADVARAWQPMTFGALFSGPRDFRGVPWLAVKPFYVRKTGPDADRRVPPWGGVKRIAGEILWFASDVLTGRKQFRRADKVYGNVKGRLRPSGQRTKQSSVVGMDSNEMVRQFTRNPVLSADKRTITFSTNRPEAPSFNEDRPFAFFNAGDQKKLNQFGQLWLGRVAKGEAA